MYDCTVKRTEAGTADLVEALRPVADACRVKKWHTKDGEPKPDFFILEIGIPVRQARKIIDLVDAADFTHLLKTA
jgi:hypothetical protein